MAIINNAELASLRRSCERSLPQVNYTKAQINLALQAIENWFETSRPSLIAAINSSTAPFVFTGQQKVQLVKFWLEHKFNRE